MNIEELCDYCASMEKAEATFPFDETTLVYKVWGKMFAMIPLESNDVITLKCDPDRAVELRELYEGVQLPRYMSHKYWITIHIDSDVSDTLIRELVMHSYHEVLAKIPRSKRQ